MWWYVTGLTITQSSPLSVMWEKSLSSLCAVKNSYDNLDSRNVIWKATQGARKQHQSSLHPSRLPLAHSLSVPSLPLLPSPPLSAYFISQLLAGRHCLPVSGSGRIATAFLPPQALCPITPHSAAPSPSPALVHNFPLLPIRVEILSEVHTLIMSHPFSSSVSDEPHKQPQAFS